MATKDGKSNVKFLGSIAPQALTGNVNGSAIDVSDFESVTLVAHGDGTAVGTVKIQESNTLGGTYADVSADDVIGTQDNDVNASDTEITIGYIGHKGFVRAVWTHTTNGSASVGFNLGHPYIAPVGGND